MIKYVVFNENTAKRASHVKSFAACNAFVQDTVIKLHISIGHQKVCSNPF